MTSWRSRFSWARAAAKSTSSTFALSAAICDSVMFRPRSRSASANATQSFRQVENFVWPDQSAAMFREA